MSDNNAVYARDDSQPVTISSGRDGLCLSLPQGDSTPAGNGVPVISMDCDQASGWYIDRGSGSVLLAADPTYALDAGQWPGNFGSLKIWTSYPGLYQQTWYYTNDDRIAITGGNQCLDEGDNGIQTYQCTNNDGNQGRCPLSLSLSPSISLDCLAHFNIVWYTTEIEYCD
ncbi:hypothetical protein BD324DRAFT_578166 [Kockovaella imperatae]|uniref:Ricin B lectin domain-containing protein n=1 Tax=Kockovaella imperatae TaxID=4999 RepID=A0A1Y1UJN1_9TREE|nr:hypothetical protein BD324DRAFT_578166 [Kockovaella imperatae]ORX38189.1 hypothetical protein BD324DRAFT_578166 [Kockovaella imperatae]